MRRQGKPERVVSPITRKLPPVSFLGFDHSTVFGGALFLAVDSKVGPIYLAYGRSEGGHSALYLYLGSSIELYQR